MLELNYLTIEISVIEIFDSMMSKENTDNIVSNEEYPSLLQESTRDKRKRENPSIVRSPYY